MLLGTHSFSLSLGNFETKNGSFDLTASSAGGGSDGNFTGFLGIPTLDGLGVKGAGLHTLNEHIEIASLVERARLISGMLMRLS